MTFDAAVCEYLHRTGRQRPWTRRREEDALDGLSGWLRATLGTVPLHQVTAQLVARYAVERRLTAQEVEDLHGTLAGLLLWARAAGVDPIELVSAAGEDYELLATFPEGRWSGAVEALAGAGVALADVGRVRAGSGVVLRDRDGTERAPAGFDQLADDPT